jgi:uncharacterized protein YggE
MLGLLFACASAVACAQEPEHAPFLAIQGRAEMRVVPDLFPLVITIEDKSLEPNKAQEAVEAEARVVLERARRLKLPDADIELGNVRIRPDSRYDNDTGKETFLGTSYTRQIGLNFHRLADLKAFLAQTPESKLVRLQTEEFRLADTAKARRVLFLEAIENARQGAELAAKALGKRVIGVQTASDQPLALARGSYGINMIDVASVESSTILTAEQIARIPVPRDITSVALIGDPHAPRTTEVALDEGVIKLSGAAYVIYLIGD